MDEARIWVARVNSRDMSDAERAAFEAWLDKNPDHRAAFDKAQELWQTLGALSEDFAAMERRDEADAAHEQTSAPGTPSEHARPSVQQPRRGIAMRSAAAIAAVIAVCLIYFSEDLWIAAVADAATGSGQKAEVTLPDNSRVTLNTASAITIDYSPKERRIHLLKGEAFFVVNPDAARPFQVEAADGLSQAVGTAFAVRKTGASVVVTVSSGEVAVQPSDRSDKGQDSRQLLGADRQIAYDDGTVTVPLHTVDASKVLAWRAGEIVFEDVRFSDAVAELDRYFPGRIIIASGVRNAPRVSGIFQTDKVETAIRAVAAVHGLSIARAPGNRLWVLY